MKKILFYIGSLGSGGAERQLVYTALGLSKKGYKIKILINYNIIHYEDILKKENIDIVCTNTSSKMLFKRFYLILKEIRNFKPDIVHSFLSERNLEAMLLSRLLRVKIRIASIRNVSKREFKYFYMYKNFSTKIICNTERAQIYLAKKYNIQDKLKVIYNGIDLEKFSDLQDKKLSKKNHEISAKRVGICIGRIEEQKNHISLLKALIQLFKENILLKEDIFLLVGNKIDQKIYAEINQLIVENNLQKNIKYLGVIKNIKEILSASDYLILPSKWEGFPNVLMEAIASNVFVIATDVGGTKELLKDNENGILIKLPEERYIYESIKEFLKMNENMIELKKKKAKEFIQKFDLKNYIEQVEKTYKDLE